GPAWVLFLVMTLVATVLSVAAVHETWTNEKEATPTVGNGRTERARSAAWTARLVIALSASVFTVLTLPLWAALWVIVVGQLKWLDKSMLSVHYALVVPRL